MVMEKMISKISKIKDLGIYKNFIWDSTKLNDFKNVNLIYGWNYSGKTTLSELFRSIEKKERVLDYGDFKFEIIDSEGNKYSESNINSIPFRVKVFNSKFVKENLDFDGSNAKPILIIGEEKIELRKEIKKISEDENYLIEERKEKESELNLLKNEVDNRKTDLARNIKEILSLTNYTRIHLELDDYENNYSNFILSEESVLSKKNEYSQECKSEKVPNIQISLPDLGNIKKDVSALLMEVPMISERIEEIRGLPKRESWIREGVGLHTELKKCLFCGSDLTTERVDKLNKHFSKEYESLMERIKSKILGLENKKINYKFVDKAVLLSNFRKSYETEKKNINIDINKLNSSLHTIIDILNSKKEKMFEQIFLGEIFGVNISCDKINSVINDNNTAIDDFEKNKNLVREELKKHYQCKFLRDFNLKLKKQKVEELEKVISLKKSEIEKKEQEKNKKLKEISEEHKGAELLNKYIRSYNPELNISIKFEVGNFYVYRNQEIAKNLSEGEKTAISFVYFLATLEDKSVSDLNKTIVFIDDPISSLDSNHIFKAYSTIFTTLFEEKTPKISQLFISTHNFQFFDLVKERLKRKIFNINNNNCKQMNGCVQSSIYLVEKKKDGEGFFSELKNIPCSLCRFRSEYHYLFYRLNKFKDSGEEVASEDLYIMPNILRRFLEAFLGFKIPNGQGWDAKMKLLFNSVGDRELIHKITNQYSHQGSADRIFSIPPYQEVLSCVKMTLDNLKRIDEDHYNGLML